MVGSHSIATVGNAVIQAYKNIRPLTAADAEMNQQTTRGLMEWFKQPNRRVTSAASICISRFVESEMDATTQGTRGMGRLDEKTPRFAGKHRSYIQALTHQEKEALAEAFSLCMLTGYLMAECFGEWVANLPMERNPNMANGETLLYRFVPHIFAAASTVEFDRLITNAQGSEENYQFVKSLWISAFGDAIVDFWKTTGLSINGYEWLVVRYLFNAGIALRLVESYPGTEEQHYDVVTGGAYSFVQKHPELVQGTSGCALLAACVTGASVAGGVVLWW
jgi:hypothetical protein